MNMNERIEERVRQERAKLEKLCDAVVEARRSGGDVEQAMVELRVHVLVSGISDDRDWLDEPPLNVDDISTDNHPVEVANHSKLHPQHVPKRKIEMTLRGRVWKLLLGIDEINAKVYLDLLDRGKSPYYAKIRRDSFRTFPRDNFFQNAVPEQRIIRLLNAFVHEYGDVFSYAQGMHCIAAPFHYNMPELELFAEESSKVKSLSGDVFGYVQGMNCIAAPFLYNMPELDAFFAFCKFVTQCFPLYWIDYVAGATAGCQLVDETLKAADNEVYEHLRKLGLSCKIYGFHSVQSLSASIPPFRELIRLWDILIAFGPHLNVLSVVGHVHQKRTELLAATSANECQHALNARHASPLNAQSVIIGTLVVVQKIKTEKDLYRKLVAHSYDPTICSEVLGRAGDKAIQFAPVGPPTGRKASAPSRSKQSKKSPAAAKKKASSSSSSSVAAAADQGEESDSKPPVKPSASALRQSRTGRQDLQGDRTTLRRKQGAGKTSPSSHKKDLSTEES